MPLPDYSPSSSPVLCSYPSLLDKKWFQRQGSRLLIPSLLGFRGHFTGDSVTTQAYSATTLTYYFTTFF